jgi:hypothetical protein
VAILIETPYALEFPQQGIRNMNIRYLIVPFVFYMLSTRAIAADDPFVGNWKLRPDKSRFVGFQEKIEDLGNHKYRFTTGDKVETIVLDGEDHSTGGGTTWALKEIGPNKWKSIDKIDGQIIVTSIWTVSDDGQRFTSVTEGIKNDGSTYKSQFTAKRLAGTSGLIGTWGNAERARHTPVNWSIKPYQGDGLSFISRDDGEQIDLKFDGEDYPDRGPHVAPGSTVSGKRASQRVVELLGKINGKLIYSQRLQVSEDGQKLAVGIALTGTTLSGVDFYDRQ